MKRQNDVTFDELLAYAEILHKGKKAIYCPSGDELEALRLAAEDRDISVAREVNGRVGEKVRRVRSIIFNDLHSESSDVTDTILDSVMDNAVYSILEAMALLEEVPDEIKEQFIRKLKMSVYGYEGQEVQSDSSKERDRDVLSYSWYYDNVPPRSI